MEAAQAALDREQEIERIKELRVRRAELEKTLAEGQKAIYKQCYSRPLYKWNAHLNELTDKEGDYSFLNKEVKAEMKKQIVSKLLEKVTSLESKVTTDMNTHLYSARGGRGGDEFSDTASRYSQSALGGMSRQQSGRASAQSGMYGGLRNRLRKLQHKPKN